jgi:hypothetical protein
MTENRFEQIVDETLNQIRDTLLVKGVEYRRNQDPFHNFNQGSVRSQKHRLQVLDGFLLKHEVSISDICDDIIYYNKKPKIEIVNEKLGDNLIYLLIKKAMLIDIIENEKLENS